MSQDLESQMIHSFNNEAEKKLLMQNYIIGKLVSSLMRKGFLKVREIDTDNGVKIEAEIEVVEK